MVVNFRKYKDYFMKQKIIHKSTIANLDKYFVDKIELFNFLNDNMSVEEDISLKIVHWIQNEKLRYKE